MRVGGSGVGQPARDRKIKIIHLVMLIDGRAFKRCAER